jgi:septal ring-binding cell division protein DamX
MSFEGEIGEIDLVQRLVELGREKFTGAIRFEQDGIIKIVYFKGGDVLSASTNDRTDAVDEILFRAGKVNKEHIKQALARRKDNETLGDALLNLGFITRKELTWARRIQVIGILRSVRAWTKGAFAIVADYLPKREEGTLFPLQQIIVELFVTEQDRQPFERALDGGSAVLKKIDGFDAAFERLGLNEEAAEIVSKIDGERNASEIAAAAAKDAFNTYKLLEALRALGLLNKAQAKDEMSFESVGVADAADAWSSGRMPAFQTEPEPPVQPVTEAAPPPIAIPKIEHEWGFDEAQIETVQRAAEPPKPVKAAAADRTATKRSAPAFTRPQASAKTSRAPVFALIVILFLAAAGYGFWYWMNLTKVPPPAIVERPVKTMTSVGGGPPAVIRPAEGPASTRTSAPAPMTQPAEPQPATPKEPSPPKPKPGNFTVQFELVCQQASLSKAKQEGGSKVWSVPLTYRGQSCYRVFWGRYETRAEAEAGAAEIPAALRAGSKPVVVSVPK